MNQDHATTQTLINNDSPIHIHIDNKLVKTEMCTNFSGQFYYTVSYDGQGCGALFPYAPCEYEHFGDKGMRYINGLLEEAAIAAIVLTLQNEVKHG